jgi:Lipase
VECIHTGYYFGIRAKVCQTDFFVNGGSKQPGCINYFGIDNVVCSHQRAVIYYTEALHKPNSFYGDRCDQVEDALTGSCSKNSGAFMGNEGNADAKLSGIYYVETNLEPPYGRGKR